jgi:hypothetical protein
VRVQLASDQVGHRRLQVGRDLAGPAVRAAVLEPGLVEVARVGDQRRLERVHLVGSRASVDQVGWNLQ